MRKAEAIELIDNHKNKLVDPVAMLHWSWLRVVLHSLPEKEWDAAVEKAVETLSQ